MDQLPAPANPDIRSTGWKWGICGLLFLATVLNYMDRMALNQTALRIRWQFGLNNQQYGFLEGVFSAAFAVGALGFGWLVDRANVRWVYLLVVFGWSAAGLLTGFAQSWTVLLLCRIMLGLFEAGNWPSGIRTTQRILPPAQRSLGNAIFQSGTALGAVLTPLVVLTCLGVWAAGEISEPKTWPAAGAVLGGMAVPVFVPHPDAWRLPFVMIGGLGLLWVVLWLALVRSRHVAPRPEEGRQGGGGESYWRIWGDRRFWVLIVLIVAVNHVWHSFRVWTPSFLQLTYGYNEAETQMLSSAYYLMADAGSISVGVVTLWLVGRGWSVHRSRLAAYLGCALLALLSVPLALLPAGFASVVLLFVIGFAALGLFPTYFALTQEISARHQGKVTGTLGFINALYLAFLFPLQGRLIDATGSFRLVMALAGLPPMLGFLALVLFWRNREPLRANDE